MDYIDNESLLKELRIYKEKEIITEELGNMLLTLAQRYSNSGSFVSYTWKDDMVNEAILTCLKYMYNIDTDLENSNPLSYFKITIYRSFLSYIARQKKHSKIKDICYKNLNLIMDNDVENDDDFKYFNIHGIDYQSIKGDKKRKRKKVKKETVDKTKE